MSLNANLHQAKDKKNDEFYTQLGDIEKELSHYKECFKGKTVLCNCDNPRVSNFFKFFALKFSELGLKRLITTCYKSQDADLFSQNECESAVYLDYYGNDAHPNTTDFSSIKVKTLKGDGDFRSAECIELLKQADIVVTNPPFSLFREYVAQLVKYDKKFVIIGNKNAITYKEIFPLIKDNKLWIGDTPMSTDLFFSVPKENEKKLLETKKEGSAYRIINGKIYGRSQSIWFTNLETKKRHENLVFYKKYTPEEYPKYDNYDAINVDKVSDIPEDYNGIMGVPITFLDKYNPEQFDILGDSRYHDGNTEPNDINFLNGKELYRRILIRRKKS